MGLFDFLKNKNTGIEDNKFNSMQFQNEVCALALWKLEQHNDVPDEAKKELKKIGLNDIQIDLILNKVYQFKSRELQKGINENIFSSEQFQKDMSDYSLTVYTKNNHNYHVVKQELLKQGLSTSQSEQVISKLKLRMSAMVGDLQQQLDSGTIKINITPNAEHVKGKVDADQIDKYIGYGAFQMEQGNLENAMELFDKAIALDENATLAFANKGTLYLKKGDHEKALYFYNKALTIEPNHVQILENKLDLLFEMLSKSSENEFIETAQIILRNEPDHPNALIYVIQYHVKENDIESALALLKRLFSNYHSEGISTQLLLDIFNKLPIERALVEFENFKNEIDTAAHYQLRYGEGLFLMGTKEYEKSIDIFTSLNRLQEFSWNYYQMAIIRNFQGKTDECLALLGTTFRLEPELKEDARSLTYFQNLSSDPRFTELVK